MPGRTTAAPAVSVVVSCSFGSCPDHRIRATSDSCRKAHSDQRLGGDEEDRTPDLRIANATLSQLSYVPTGDILPSATGAVQAGVRLRINCAATGVGLGGGQ